MKENEIKKDYPVYIKAWGIIHSQIVVNTEDLEILKAILKKIELDAIKIVEQNSTLNTQNK